MAGVERFLYSPVLCRARVNVLNSVGREERMRVVGSGGVRMVSIICM